MQLFSENLKYRIKPIVCFFSLLRKKGSIGPIRHPSTLTSEIQLRSWNQYRHRHKIGIGIGKQRLTIIGIGKNAIGTSLIFYCILIIVNESELVGCCHYLSFIFFSLQFDRLECRVLGVTFDKFLSVKS